jgi:hypothetical protein
VFGPEPHEDKQESQKPRRVEGVVPLFANFGRGRLRRMSRRLPLLVGVIVALLGWAAVALGGPSLGENRAEACGVPFEEEPVGYTLDWALWPPGATTCEWSGPPGSSEQSERRPRGSFRPPGR